MQAVSENVIESLNTLKEEIMSLLDELKNEMPNKGRDMMDGLRKGIDERKPSIINTLLVLAAQIPTQFNSTVSLMSSKGQEIMDSFRSGIQNGANSVYTALQQIGNALPGYLSNAATQMSSVGNNMMTSLAQAIQVRQSYVIDAMVAAVLAAIKAAERAAGIASPSKRAQYIGNMIVEGMENSLVAGRQSMATAGRGLVDAAFSQMGGGTGIGGVDGGASGAGGPMINIEEVNVYQPEAESIFETMRQMRWNLEDMALGLR
jgi:hypothetical protein